MNVPTITDVKDFWEANPLFSGESRFEVGSEAFFEEHRRIYLEDCFAGRFDDRTLPPEENCEHVLDLGCGPGFWIIELDRRCELGRITGADLTQAAIALAARRAEIYEVEADFSVQNAERLTFEDATFSHVNCQGVVHHTPNTAAAISEIARVLQPNGTASISVYYKNVVIRRFSTFSALFRTLRKIGAKLPGRGREEIYAAASAEDIIRLYDGAQNPIGKGYSRDEFVALLTEHFHVEEVFFHFFPARSLPIRVPRIVHRWLDRALPFMIYTTLRKR